MTARFGAVVLAAACVAGQLADLSHLAAPHVTCAEHGELMEAPLEKSHAAEPTTPWSSVDRGADPAQSPGHEHCLFAAHARQQAGRSTAGVRVVAVALQAEPRPILAVPVLPVEKHQRYRLAPKTSPPV